MLPHVAACCRMDRKLCEVPPATTTATATATTMKKSKRVRVLHTLMSRQKAKQKQTVAHGIQLPPAHCTPSPSLTLLLCPSLPLSIRLEPIFNCARAKKATAGNAKRRQAAQLWHAESL